jgi:hypothetical protein
MFSCTVSISDFYVNSLRLLGKRKLKSSPPTLCFLMWTNISRNLTRLCSSPSGFYPLFHCNVRSSDPDQVMRDFWQTKWKWGGISPRTSVAPANSHSTNCSTLSSTLCSLEKVFKFPSDCIVTKTLNCRSFRCTAEQWCYSSTEFEALTVARLQSSGMWHHAVR